MSSNCGDEGITSAIAEFGELGLADEVVAAHNTSLVSFEDRVNSMFWGDSPKVVELIALCSLTIMTQMLEKMNGVFRGRLRRPRRSRAEYGHGFDIPPRGRRFSR